MKNNIELEKIRAKIDSLNIAKQSIDNQIAELTEAGKELIIIDHSAETYLRDLLLNCSGKLQKDGSIYWNSEDGNTEFLQDFKTKTIYYDGHSVGKYLESTYNMNIDQIKEVIHRVICGALHVDFIVN